MASIDLQHLYEQTDRLGDERDRVSEEIRRTEKAIQKAGIPFQWDISIEQGKEMTILCIKDNSLKYRLYGHARIKHKLETRPLIEFPWTIRKEFYAHLNKFVEKLTVKIKESI